MKRMLVWVAVTVVVAAATFAWGSKRATDRYKGDDCRDWMVQVVRDAQIESDSYTRPSDRYNLQLAVFDNAILHGVYFEGRNWAEPQKEQARVAPHKICSFDNSSAWEKYGPAKLATRP
jgi:hypothetical protein